MGGNALKCKVQAVKCKSSASKNASNKVQAESDIKLGAECKPFPFLFWWSASSQSASKMQAVRVQAECKQSATKVQAEPGIPQGKVQAEMQAECKRKNNACARVYTRAYA